MDESLVNSILNLYKNKNWKAIVSRYHDHPDRSKLLWVFPTEENFAFLRDSVLDLGCDGILSIGCGSGLLEWMITEATGFPVSGIEIDGAWWHCKYAPPTFIPLILTTPTLNSSTISLLRDAKSVALLFCYFNNGPAFAEYIKHYSGPVIVIIGPGCGKGVHTDPTPFEDLGEEWKMYRSQEIRDSQDYIAIYQRNQNIK
ncbi:unnamed protein product [Parnassius mnemosyne]|uniref:Uncharacterized protein n=1 Tax=Parnassius mnemosyne TaxID=213953 RepID=A0AAV1K7Q8_9NEOP